MAMCIWPHGFAGSGVDVRFPGPAVSRGEGAPRQTAQLSVLSHGGCTTQREQGAALQRPSFNKAQHSYKYL